VEGNTLKKIISILINATLCAVLAMGGTPVRANTTASQARPHGTVPSKIYLPLVRKVFPPSPLIVPITAGFYHTCGLTAAGGVKCWGRNEHGQLGDNTTTNHYTPVGVSGLTSGVKTLAAGGEHACALTAGGGVKCWGYNLHGQLGDGTTTDRHTPVDGIGLASGVLTVAANEFHTCALTAGGGVKCWGDNDFGQLGDGTTTDRSTPVDVVGLASGVRALAVGAGHACALTAGGGVKCWGDNWAGQLGDGTITERLTPVDVVGLASGVQALTAGQYHICALLQTGGVKCWGWNNNGQLGDGSISTRLTPVDVSGLASGVQALAAGGIHTCALTAGGGVKCWGNNGSGELGDDTTTERHTPVDVFGLESGVRALTAGQYHTCALAVTGGVKCWGDNEWGQLGDDTTTDRRKPVDVIGFP
jgi:alpha-tubulin suppressor-like RCC1 family protein